MGLISSIFTDIEEQNKKVKLLFPIEIWTIITCYLEEQSSLKTFSEIINFNGYKDLVRMRYPHLFPIRIDYDWKKLYFAILKNIEDGKNLHQILRCDPLKRNHIPRIINNEESFTENWSSLTFREWDINSLRTSQNYSKIHSILSKDLSIGGIQKINISFDLLQFLKTINKLDDFVTNMNTVQYLSMKEHYPMLTTKSRNEYIS